MIFILLIFKLYFIDYAITVVLIFTSLLPSTQHPPLPQQSPHYCSCPWVMCMCSLATPFPMRYFTSPWLFCNYLSVLLNPLTSSPFHHTALQSSNQQNTLHIHDSVSVLVCVACFFIQLLIDMYLLPFYCS